MRPIWIILYAVIVTLGLTVFLPRLRQANPKLLWIASAAGLVVLVIIVVLTLAR